MLKPQQIVLSCRLGFTGLLFVHPVSGHTVLCSLIHLAGTYLNLHGSAGRTYYCCVQRLIKIELWHRDVVFESTRHWVPARMNGTENCITIANRTNKNPDTDQVVNLIEFSAPNNHLLIDAVILLWPTGNLTFDALRFQIALYCANYLV